jgi:predicted nicotinamide N-methyase
MDTLVQISAKYGSGVILHSNKQESIIKVYFVGHFEIHNEDNINIDNVYVYQNPINQKVIHFGGYDRLPIHIMEMDESEGGIGCGIWLSSLVLSSWIIRNKHMFNNKTVLELGCGVGLCGLTVAHYTKPLRLTLTDNDVSLFDCLKGNVESNSSKINIIPSTIRYDWNCAKNETGTSKYDMILASDCVYHTTKDILLDAILCNLKLDGYFVIANPPDWNRPGFDEFIYALQQHGEVSIERANIIMNKTFTKTIWLIVFKRTE